MKQNLSVEVGAKAAFLLYQQHLSITEDGSADWQRINSSTLARTPVILSLSDTHSAGWLALASLGYYGPTSTAQVLDHRPAGSVQRVSTPSHLSTAPQRREKKERGTVASEQQVDVRAGVDKAESTRTGLTLLSLSFFRTQQPEEKNTGYWTVGVVVVAGVGGGERASRGGVEDTFRSPGGYTCPPVLSVPPSLCRVNVRHCATKILLCIFSRFHARLN
jgi:hypothetical protein